MVLTLSAGDARATVLPERGGLVSALSLRPLRGGSAREILWTAAELGLDESGWPGGGLPVLFPFAGRVFHEGRPLCYELGGVERSMPIHGFAYGMPWEIAAQSADSARLSLRPTAATLRLFPFAFEVELELELSASALRVVLTAKHAASAPRGVRMPVAMGLHPYFRAPLATGALSDVRLLTSACTKVAVTNAGAAGRASPLGYADATERGIALSETETRSLILVDHAAPAAALRDAGPDQLELAWGGDFKTLVLWRQEGAGFQCVEPWMGLPDAVGAGAAGGTRWLEPGESAWGEFRIVLA